MPDRKRSMFLLPGTLAAAGVLLLLFSFQVSSPARDIFVVADMLLFVAALVIIGLRAYRNSKADENGSRAMEKSLGLLVQHIKDYAIFLVDPEGRVISWNKGAQQIKGYAEDEVLGKSISIFYTDEEAASGEPFRNLKRALENGRFESIGLRKRKDGTLFHADVVFTPLFDKKQQLTGFIKITRDISEQKKAEEEMKSSLDREKEVSELKSRFVTLASHEFKTPLSVILSSVSLIERYVTTEEQEKRVKHIHRIKNNVNNLKQILNDFLSLEKLEGGLVQNSPAHTELVPLLAGIIQDMEEGLKAGQQIAFEVQGEPRPIMIDKQLLLNVLNNLLSNASKYSPEDAPIRCVLSFLGDAVKIAVIDQGLGIPPEDQRRLFERFFRASNVVGIPGTGLGLSIVHKYIELMGGHITVNSAPGQGSTFTVILPRRKSSSIAQAPV